MKNKIPIYKQLDTKDCGPTCLKIVAKYFGVNISLSKIRELSETTRIGSSLKGLADAAEQIGLLTLPAKLAYNQLHEIPLPAILHWDKKHFVILYKVSKNKIYVSDPAHGLLTYKSKDFLIRWIGNNATENIEEGIGSQSSLFLQRSALKIKMLHLQIQVKPKLN